MSRAPHQGARARNDRGRALPALSIGLNTRFRAFESIGESARSNTWRSIRGDQFSRGRELSRTCEARS